MKATRTKAPSRRRIPSQERSRERVSRILDAAAHEFADRGIEVATMEGIADRAHTSVGSIYQFFPNKRAVYEALADRYHDEIRALFGVLVSEDAVDIPWEQVIGAAIDAYAELHRSSITARAVWTNFLYSQRFWEAGEEINRDFAERAADLLDRFAKATPRAPLRKLPPARRKLIAMTLIETISVLLLRSLNLPRPQATALLDEAKLVATRYLAPYLG